MKNSNLILLTVSLLAASPVIAASPGLAGDGEALAKKNNCMMCHSLEGKSTGPTFQNIATKYKTGKDAQAQLEKKVRSGGSGVWGSMPMPPTAKSVSDSDIKSMVQWILSIKPR